MSRSESSGASQVRRWGVVTLVIALALTVAGCASTDSNDDAGETGTITWVRAVDLRSTDPSIDAGGYGPDWEIFRQVYDTLVELDNEGDVVPSLATEWEQSSPTSYLFTIRSGVKFSNGREMTPDDVAGTLNRIADPETGSFWQTQLGIASANVVGTDQVEVTLAQPRTAFIPALTGAMASILPMEEFEAQEFDPSKSLLGTGPYMLEDRVPDVSLTLTRNPHHWGTEASAEMLDIKILSDDSARLAALRDGSAQVATFDSPDAVTLLEGVDNVETVVQEQSNYYYAMLNAKNSVLSDPNLRAAVALAIDRAELAELATAGVGEPTAAVARQFDVCDPQDVPFGQPDLDEARSLVEAAGATGTKINILAGSSGATGKPIAEVLQQQLEEIGLDPEVLMLETGAYIERVFVDDADFDIALSYYATYSDPAMILANFIPRSSGFNAGYLLDDPELNQLIADATTLPDGSERTDALQGACAKIAENANAIPLITKPGIVAHRSDKIEANILDTQSNNEPLSNISEFSVK